MARGDATKSIGTKLVARVVAERPQQWLDQWRRVDQTGFTTGRGTDDAH